MTKTCNKCQVEKHLNQYAKDPRNKSGLQGICETCRAEAKRLSAEARRLKGAEVARVQKTCNKCNEAKAIDLFYKDSGIADGRATICKKCKTENTYKWRENNREQYNKTQRDYQKTACPERRYGTEIKRRYGCTLEQYNDMLVAQAGACAICKSLHNPAEKKGRLYVDHCHKTGAVRALLCKHCNSLLGYAKDDARILLEAVAYLGRHKNSS